MSYVWCNKEHCRIPAFRCLLCRQECHPQGAGQAGEKQALAILWKTGKYEERFVMKRKEKSAAKEGLSAAANENDSLQTESLNSTQDLENNIFLLENGKLVPFRSQDYTASILYQRVESFAVESKLVRPEDSAPLLYEGKKPSKKTVPIMVMKNDDCLLLESWDDLESNPGQLADAAEVIGAVAVRQVFVLKRKTG
jgi:hypothetical protein